VYVQSSSQSQSQSNKTAAVSRDAGERESADWLTARSCVYLLFFFLSLALSPR